jgi:hypothetical protein
VGAHEAVNREQEPGPQRAHQRAARHAANRRIPAVLPGRVSDQSTNGEREEGVVRGDVREEVRHDDLAFRLYTREMFAASLCGCLRHIV